MRKAWKINAQELKDATEMGKKACVEIIEIQRKALKDAMEVEK